MRLQWLGVVLLMTVPVRGVLAQAGPSVPDPLTYRPTTTAGRVGLSAEVTAVPPYLAEDVPRQVPKGEVPPDSLPCLRPASLEIDRLAGNREEYARHLQLTGDAPLQPWLARRLSGTPSLVTCADRLPRAWASPVTAAAGRGPLLRVLPLGMVVVNNSGYPDDRNNGALWAGRGLSSELRGGAALRWGALSAAVAPSLSFSQNRAFPVDAPRAADLSEWAYPLTLGRMRLDMPQRFGDDPLWNPSLGQSFLRLDVGKVGLGVSNENFWWGPGSRSSILMTSTAPGFPHLFVGTGDPVNVGIGHVEAEFVWGRLSESDFFNSDRTDDPRVLAGMFVGFAPRGLPGLYLGAARTFHETVPPEGLEFADYFRFFETIYKRNLVTPDNPDGGDRADQMISVMARWAFPEVGFEVYAELARNDHNSDLSDLQQEPDHTLGRLLGFQKVVPLDESWVRLTGEAINLGPSATSMRRGGGSVYYLHNLAPQGHTNRGQLLGAWSGTGSDAQHLSLDLVTPTFLLGTFAERVRRGEEAYHHLTKFSEVLFDGHDIELIVGLRQLFFWNDLELGWSLSRAERRNRNIVFGRREENLRFQLQLGWQPARGEL